MLDTIICPQCKEEIPLDEAIKHRMREQILLSVQQQHAKDIEETRKKAIQEIQSKVEEETKKKIEEAKKQAVEEERKSLNDKYETTILLLKRQLEQKDNKEKEYKQNELELRDRVAKAEQKEKDIDIIIKRKVDNEVNKAEQLAVDNVTNKYKMELLDRDKREEDLKKKIEELQKKANPTSQKLQGEVLELDIQSLLERAFPDDDVTEVKPGQSGSDILQVVKTARGNICGKILWECKRVSTWRAEFIELT